MRYICTNDIRIIDRLWIYREFINNESIVLGRP